MNAGGNVRCSVAILGEHDLTHQTARVIIERINPVTRKHASALAPRKANQPLGKVTGRLGKPDYGR